MGDWFERLGERGTGLRGWVSRLMVGYVTPCSHAKSLLGYYTGCLRQEEGINTGLTTAKDEPASRKDGLLDQPAGRGGRRIQPYLYDYTTFGKNSECLVFWLKE